MIHDPELLDKLAAYPKTAFASTTYRATRKNLDPTAPSTRGGRWAPRDDIAVLYTSLARDGAIAELAFHWMQLTPLPSKPMLVHELRVTASSTLRLIEADLEELGVSMDDYHNLNYNRTQRIGAAVAFLGCDGLLVPSARWDAENMVLFSDNHGLDERLNVTRTDDVDWKQWAKEHNWL